MEKYVLRHRARIRSRMAEDCDRIAREMTSEVKAYGACFTAAELKQISDFCRIACGIAAALNEEAKP